MLKIGFLGGGKMAQALAKGFIKSGLTKGELVLASCAQGDDLSVKGFEELQSKTTFSNSRVAEHGDVLVLAVKPQVVSQVLPQIENSIKGTKKVLMSIAMGISIKNLEDNLPAGTPIVRVMPNLPAVVGQGASVYVRGSHASPQDLELAQKLFSAVGICDEVPEGWINAVTALAGSGPAYVYMMIESMASGAIKMGLPRDLAYRLASQTVLGAGTMAMEQQAHPAQLRDDVSSPAGSTITAIHALEKGGFRGAVMDAIEAATLRCDQFSKVK
ncbi:pyrroline-5-carboxylate reductase 3 [Trichogramma pretiosum]|uniref:pyrroline-5-carboxylate reductase 3 n=1 Tax=Trichogramma pretiosum TaxID=7493 RepID=UPI0006C941D0|nr:pyrroline-5-carboxylate reductase 3 [Trichogramma pretiosum]